MATIKYNTERSTMGKLQRRFDFNFRVLSGMILWFLVAGFFFYLGSEISNSFYGFFSRGQSEMTLYFVLSFVLILIGIADFLASKRAYLEVYDTGISCMGSPGGIMGAYKLVYEQILYTEIVSIKKTPKGIVIQHTRGTITPNVRNASEALALIDENMKRHSISKA